jgi:tetratricopeptide (TPR) repeat protein
MQDFNAALKLKPDDIDVLVARSGLYVLRRQPVMAKADLDAADKAAASDPAQRLKIAAAYAREDYDQPAIDELNQWIAANPNDNEQAAALNLRCRLRGLLNQDLPKAAEDCEAALKRAPGDPSVLESRGLLRLRQGDFDRAIADYNASLKIEPTRAWALYGRGLARLKKGLTADGQADLKAAEAISPRIADAAAKRGLTP